ncbi:MAG TPA: hypothetical protein IAC31_05265 [Candidatus Faecousia intestinigallinarum]|nr:hypothetical protein [Candidatus Faecousia intestinigallinarum]
MPERKRHGKTQPGAWREISSAAQAEAFVRQVAGFHDSCVKELHYLSGAYVNADLAMHPVNESRRLRMVMQQQNGALPAYEMEFSRLLWLKLAPSDEAYTCEILDASLFFQEGQIYWCDCGGLGVEDLTAYSGTVICAEALRWRPLAGALGSAPQYTSSKD